MTISRDQVRHVAMLARLDLEPGEEDFYAAQLNDILRHIDRLAELDTDAIPPTALVIRAANVMREDEPRPCLGPERALANAPVSQDGMIVVKTILERTVEESFPPSLTSPARGEGQAEGSSPTSPTPPARGEGPEESGP